MTALQAVFHNTKRIASRKTYQVILEVPEEMQEKVHEVLGYPNSNYTIWVAVARLNIAVDEQNQCHE